MSVVSSLFGEKPRRKSPQRGRTPPRLADVSTTGHHPSYGQNSTNSGGDGRRRSHEDNNGYAPPARPTRSYLGPSRANPRVVDEVPAGPTAKRYAADNKKKKKHHNYRRGDSSSSSSSSSSDDKHHKPIPPHHQHHSAHHQNASPSGSHQYHNPPPHRPSSPPPPPPRPQHKDNTRYGGHQSHPHVHRPTPPRVYNDNHPEYTHAPQQHHSHDHENERHNKRHHHDHRSHSRKNKHSHAKSKYLARTTHGRPLHEFMEVSLPPGWHRDTGDEPLVIPSSSSSMIVAPPTEVIVPSDSVSVMYDYDDSASYFAPSSSVSMVPSAIIPNRSPTRHRHKQSKHHKHHRSSRSPSIVANSHYLIEDVRPQATYIVEEPSDTSSYVYTAKRNVSPSRVSSVAPYITDYRVPPTTVMAEDTVTLMPRKAPLTTTYEHAYSGGYPTTTAGSTMYSHPAIEGVSSSGYTRSPTRERFISTSGTSAAEAAAASKAAARAAAHTGVPQVTTNHYVTEYIRDPHGVVSNVTPVRRRSEVL